MLPTAPQTSAMGANHAQMGQFGQKDQGGRSFLPQRLDPNAQNAALLESIMPMLVEMPALTPQPPLPIIGEGEPVGTTEALTGTPARSTPQPEALTPQPSSTLFASGVPIIGEGEQEPKTGEAVGTPVGTTPTPEALTPADSSEHVYSQKIGVNVTQTSEVFETSEVFPQVREHELYLPFVARQYVSSNEPDVMTSEGGVYHSPDEQLMVIVPEQLVDEPVRLSYTNGLASLRGAAALSEEVAESRALFALEAHQVRDKALIQWVRRPLELRLRYDDAGMAEGEEEYLRLRAYSQITNEWYTLPTSIDAENNTVTALTVEFTAYSLFVGFAPEDPCAIGVELVADTKFPFQNAPLDPDDDPIAQGTFLPLTSFVDNFPNYLGTEVYVSGTDTTGDLQKTDPEKAEPTEAKDEVKMVFPEGDVEHINAGSVPPDNVTDKFPPNEMITLSDGTEAEERMTKRSANIQLKHTANDPQWGSTGYYLVRKDITKPVILQFYTYHDGEGGVNLYIEAYDHCAVKQISLTYSNNTGGGGSTTFEYQDGESDGLGLYRADIKLPTTGQNSYQVKVEDMADYNPDGPNSVEAEYSESASNSEGFGMAEFSNKCNPQCGCAATCGVIGDPINTAYGNFTTLVKDVAISGIGDTDIELERTYNSLGAGRYEAFIGQPREAIGIFGLAWSSPQQFEIEVVDKLPLVGAGIKVNYPDGHSVRYSGVSGTMTPLTPGEVNEIVRSADTFVLTDKETLNEYHFDVIVDASSPVNRAPLVKKVDPNGNSISYTHGTHGPTQISNSAGRMINLTYNGHGLITEITGPEGLSLEYNYTGLLLTSFTDARGKTTTYEYNDDGYLTGIKTPKGHSSIQLTYDTDGRVASQTVGEAEAYTFTYDDANFKRTITDSEANSEVHQYDSDYRLLSVKDARGFTESYTYNSQDLRASLKDKEGRSWSYTYDARSNLLRTEGPLGWSLEFTYNGQDRPLTMKDAEGRTTHFTYDAKGNLTEIKNADGKTMRMTYDRGLPKTITDFNGDTISNTYDGAGDLTKVENGEGEALEMGYDGLGRMTSMKTHEQSSFTFAYDGGSELLTTLSGPLGYSMGYTYDKNGNLESETDARSNTTSYEYDESENLKKITDALSGEMSFSYDSMNNLLTMTDELERVTSYTYDETYNLTEIRAPESRKTSLTYDGMANLKRITDGEGRVTTLDYDQLDRLTDMTDELDGVTTITYDKVGNITSINDANGHVTSYVYDVLDRLRQETNAEREVTRYEYDNNSNLTQVTDAETNVTALTYDKANRLTSIENAENERVTFTYDSLGNLVELVQPNDVPIRWQYDALYRPTTLIQHVVSGGASDAETNVTYQFEYDLNGNLTKVIDPLSHESQFEYDELNRLTKDTNALSDAIVYLYDKVDNLTQVTDRRKKETKLVYDDANRLTEVTDALNGVSRYAYDRVDNLTSVTDENDHTTELAYDELNRLKEVKNAETHAIELVYDAVGNVTLFTDARSASTKLEYDEVNRLIKATDARGGETQLIYDEVGNVTQVTDANDHVTKMAYDRAYRPTSVTDAENHVTRFEYDDNGNITKVIDGNTNPTVVEYDKLDRMTGVTNAESETTRYTYDAIGNLIDIIENDGVSKRYGYDEIYRLTSVTLNHGGGGSATDSDILYQFSPPLFNDSFVYATQPLLGKGNGLWTDPKYRRGLAKDRSPEVLVDTINVIGDHTPLGSDLRSQLSD